MLPTFSRASFTAGASQARLLALFVAAATRRFGGPPILFHAQLRVNSASAVLGHLNVLSAQHPKMLTGPNWSVQWSEDSCTDLAYSLPQPPKSVMGAQARQARGRFHLEEEMQ
jgi:hypothetical protein